MQSLQTGNSKIYNSIYDWLTHFSTRLNLERYVINLSPVYVLGLFIYTVKLFHKASYQGKCLRKEMENYGHGDST